MLGAEIQNFDKKLILPTVNDTANGVRKKSSLRRHAERKECSRAKPRLYLIFPIALNVKCAFRFNCRQTNNIAISQYCSQSNDLNSPRI